jgi:hypothetical protein
MERISVQAIEFETNIEGDFIKIPQTKQLHGKHVKVIVLYHEEECGKKLKLPPIFYTPRMITRYEPFVREDIYSE